METTKAMLMQAKHGGTTAIVATPHVIDNSQCPDWETIVNRCQELQSVAQEMNIDLPIYPAAEIALSMDNLDLLPQPGPYCINGGNYALIELPAFEIPSYALEFFFTLLTRGITPILAHPERQGEIIKNPDLIVDWVQRGILVQVNAGSLLGKFGERARTTAFLLLDNNLVHFVGSDAHSARGRNPKLDQVAALIADRCGKEKVKELFTINPAKVIQGERFDVPLVDRIVYPEKQNGWRQMLSWLNPVKVWK